VKMKAAKKSMHNTWSTTLYMSLIRPDHEIKNLSPIKSIHAFNVYIDIKERPLRQQVTYSEWRQ
jgi:hypothetical protein